MMAFWPLPLPLASFPTSDRSARVSDHDDAAARGVRQRRGYTACRAPKFSRKDIYGWKERMQAVWPLIFRENLWTSLILIDGLKVEC